MGASAPNQHRTGGAEISTGPLPILTMIVAQWSGSLVLENGAQDHGGHGAWDICMQVFAWAPLLYGVMDASI